ncbi:MAG TPA: hypothetical protein VNK82_08655 [Terriglobales bacterium]|nr:hypothetical protein [Terriglobales bacterium]
MFLAAPAAAQTVRPVIFEYGEKARGRFELVNDTLEPLNVVLDARSFTVSETGEISYRPLDPSIHLKLSTMSFRIPPQQSYLVFYEAWADKAPAWFVIYSNFTGYGFKTAEGMNIRLQLPHTVYLLPKQRVKKPAVAVRKAAYDAAAKKLVLRVENLSSDFGRCLAAEVTSRRNKITHNGFPMFPERPRQVEIAWESPEPPEKVTLRFADFTLEERVTAASQ